METVVCALLVRDDRMFLVHRRPDRQWFPNVWDLPGGHVESGETRAAALVRELREEIGVEIEPPRDEPILRLVDGLDLTVWLIKEWSGEVANAAPDEHDSVGWFALDDALALEVADEEYRVMFRQALGPTPAS